MKELWTGLVELLTPPSKEGDTKCYTNVVAWANSPADYSATIARLLESDGMFVLEIDKCHPIADYEEIPEEMSRFIEWARNHPDDYVTGDRHYFPSRLA
jgi:hypothetical protein